MGHYRRERIVGNIVAISWLYPLERRIDT